METFFSSDKKKSLNKAITFVCRETDLGKVALYSSVRKDNLSKARFVLWFILNTECGFSTPEIAKEFKKQSSTIHHGIKFTKTSGIANVLKEKFKKFNDSNSNKSKKRNS